MEEFTKQEKERISAYENRKIERETLGKYFYDLSKIVFTTLVVGGVFAVISEQNKLGYLALAAIGGIATYGLAFIGRNFLKQ